MQIDTDVKIEELLESSAIMIIDFIPYSPSKEDFLELEAYYEKTKLEEFSDKIANILLKLKYFTPAFIQLAEGTRDIKCETSKYPCNQDLASLSPEQFTHVVGDVILRDYTTLNVLLLEYNVLITVSGGFAVTIYGEMKDNLLNIIIQLVRQEGLFLKATKS